MLLQKTREHEWICDAGWIIGFLLSFFVFSSAMYLAFFRGESYLFGMCVTGAVLIIGNWINGWLRE